MQQRHRRTAIPSLTGLFLAAGSPPHLPSAPPGQASVKGLSVGLVPEGPGAEPGATAQMLPPC